jgi:hypothetical protein
MIKNKDLLCHLSLHLCFRICQFEGPANKVGLKLNVIFQLLAYADDVYLLEVDRDSAKNKNSGALVNAGKEVGRELNTEKTKYTLLSRHKHAGQNHDIKIVNTWFEYMSQFTYLGMTVTNQNLIKGDIKRRWNYRSACYHSIQNLLNSRMLPKNVKLEYTRL